MKIDEKAFREAMCHTTAATPPVHSISLRDVFEYHTDKADCAASGILDLPADDMMRRAKEYSFHRAAASCVAKLMDTMSAAVS